jgi:serine acetyltransferase
MKTSVWDYVWSSLVITAVLAADLALVAFGIAPLSRRWLGPYHVIADLAAAMLLYGLLSALMLRAMLALRPLQRGEFDMDSGTFTYWKLLTVTYRLGQGSLRPLTPIFLKPLVEVLFGAKIGADVALGGTIDDPYLVTLGDGVILGNASLVSGNVIANGKIRIGDVRIGDGATVGANAIVLPGSQVGEKALVIAGAMVIADSAIPPGETWRGNPARKWI